MNAPDGSIVFLRVTLLLMAGCATTTTAGPQLEQAPATARISYGGGGGKSCDEAVVIQGARDRDAMIKAEIDWLANRYPGSVMLEERETDCAGRQSDRISIEIPGGEKLDIFFDTSQFQER